LPKNGKAAAKDLHMQRLLSFIYFEAGQREGLLAVISRTLTSILSVKKPCFRITSLPSMASTRAKAALL